MFSPAKAFVALIATAFLWSTSYADSPQKTLLVEGVELVHRFVFETPGRYHEEYWWEHIRKVERGIREYEAFHLSPDDPPGPLPVACWQKGRGTTGIGVGAVIPLPDDPDIEKFLYLISWERDAIGVHDRIDRTGIVTEIDDLRNTEQVFRDSTGREFTYRRFYQSTDYWFQRNGRITVYVAIMADKRIDAKFWKSGLHKVKGPIEEPSFEAEFIVQGCKK